MTQQTDFFVITFVNKSFVCYYFWIFSRKWEYLQLCILVIDRVSKVYILYSVDDTKHLSFLQHPPNIVLSLPASVFSIQLLIGNEGEVKHDGRMIYILVFDGLHLLTFIFVYYYLLPLTNLKIKLWFKSLLLKIILNYNTV